MKQQIGEYLKIPGMPDSNLIIIDYDFKDGEFVGYKVAEQEPPYITFGKVIYKTPIIQ